VFVAAASAQTMVRRPGESVDNVDSLRAHAAAVLEAAGTEELNLYSPQHFSRAQSAYEEANKLIEKKREEGLVRVKLRLALDEVETARRTSQAARTLLNEPIQARAAALSAGADSLNADLWRKTEDRFRQLLKNHERSSNSVHTEDVSEIAGAFRVVRRDALRNQLLKDARDRLAEAEKREGTRIIPSLILRANQAMSRAEAALAQENLEGANAEGRTAAQLSAHALALLTYIETAQKTKTPWESAVLPYDDILTEIARHLGEELDMSRGGAQAGPQLIGMIDARQESLSVQVTAQAQTQKSLEASLAEAQTSLADAQSRIAELESRLKTAQGERSAAHDALQKDRETADRVARAQALFQENEGTVLQDRDGRIVIRLQGLRFAAGATKLDKSHSKLLDKAIEAAGLFPGAGFSVAGHTDSVGGDSLNQVLSQARAQAVAVYVAEQLKLPADRIPAQGYGETEPVAPNSTPEGRARNRRVDILLTLPK